MQNGPRCKLSGNSCWCTISNVPPLSPWSKRSAADGRKECRWPRSRRRNPIP